MSLPIAPLPKPPTVLKNFFAGYPLVLWNYVTLLVAAIMAIVNPTGAAQAIWWIDGANVSGKASDSNTGLTALTPLATFGELAVRVGTSPILTTVTVHLLSSLAANDIVIKPYVLQPGCFVVTGSQGCTTVHTGTLTGAAAQATNNPPTITDTATTWTTAGPAGSSVFGAGFRFRVTSGPNIGVVAELGGSESAHVAAVSDPELDAIDPTLFNLTSVALAGTENYVIEQRPNINGILSFYDYLDGINHAGGFARYIFEGLQLPSAGGPTPYKIGNDLDPFATNFVSCALGLATGTAQYMSCSWFNGAGGGGVVEFWPGTFPILLGCMFPIGGGAGIVVVDHGCVMCADQNTWCFGGHGIFIQGLLNVGFLPDGPELGEAIGWCGSGADGITVGPSGTVAATAAGGTATWGGGSAANMHNAGYGIRSQSEGKFIYGTIPTITGVTGDTIVGGTPHPYGAYPVVPNATNGAAIVALA